MVPLEEIMLGDTKQLLSADRWSWRLDVVMSALVVISAANIFVELELKGRAIDPAVGPERRDDRNTGVMDFFRVFEQVTNVFFILEMLFRIVKSRWSFFWDPVRRKADGLNILDLFIVVLCSFDLYVIPFIVPVESGDTPGSLASVRLLRILRLTRALRVLRVITSFSKLRVLLVTTASSFFALFWSMLLVFLFIYGSAVCLCQSLQLVVEDESEPLELREWVFTWYGSGSRAIWTMFLVTFSGGWPNYVHRLVTDVHWAYSLFFVMYVWLVVFAVTRIITATFLKDTLSAASEDAEMIIREQKVAKARLANKLHELFAVADKSRDGYVTLEEFRTVVKLPKAQSYFSSLDLQISEACELFAMLDDGDGAISYEDFCSGVMRLKGQARAVDVISMMRDCRRILQRCEALDRRFDSLMASTAVL